VQLEKWSFHGMPPMGGKGAGRFVILSVVRPCAMLNH
jgi:hypothetical protein